MRKELNPVVEVTLTLLKLGVTSFGGPAAHLGYFREELVARRKWVSEQQYAELVALCQFLPGPASSQVGFALGLTRAGYGGAIAAWVAFTLPSAILLVAFSVAAFSLDSAIGQGILTGLKAVAVAVVAHAVWGMARTLTPDLRRICIGVAAAALVILLPGILTQLGAIVLGVLAGIAFCRPVSAEHAEPLATRISRRAGIIALTAFAALLVALPIAFALTREMWLGIADAFYRAGALVFGGGHVVLPLLQAEPAIHAVVDPDQFLAGYGAAQAVPGPLFTFASYLGAEMVSGVSSIGAAALALVAVFLPGMLLVIAVLPFWRQLRGFRTVRSGIAGANAAVVGILAAALYDPIITSGITGVAPLVIAVVCLALLVFLRLPAWFAVLVGVGIGVGSAALGVGV
ncbi:MAG: chromate efflux transporter [Leucobacter sp.]